MKPIPKILQNIEAIPMWKITCKITLYVYFIPHLQYEVYGLIQRRRENGRERKKSGF